MMPKDPITIGLVVGSLILAFMLASTVWAAVTISRGTEQP